MNRASLFLLVALAAGCGEETVPSGPTPGSSQPGSPCEDAADCGCWSCLCEGIDEPGQGQLCLKGVCPSGEGACASVCDLAKAKVAMATPITTCPARPNPP